MESREPNFTEYSDNSPQPNTVESEITVGERFSQDLDKINSVIAILLKDENTEPTALQEAWTVRSILAETFIDSLEPTVENANVRARIQFDVMVDKAIIFENAGNEIRYLEELDTAEAFALNSNLDDVVVSIGEELDERIQKLDTSPEALVLKLRGFVEFSNRDYLRELLSDSLDYEDFIGNVYGMILEEGGDPDEALAQLGVTEL